MKILATDLDRTLLPNGSWTSDAGAIKLFNELTQKNNVLVIYVTGRNLTLTEEAIEEYGIRFPHILVSDVGSSIYQYEEGNWHADNGWKMHIKQSSPQWDAQAIHRAIENIDGLNEQAREHCGPFKQSYTVDHGRSQEILEVVDERIKDKYDESIVYSYDSQSGKGLLDFLPSSATKKTALEYIANRFDTNTSDLVFCGDSGNDIDPLTAGFSGVLVRNADNQLTAKVKQACDINSELKVYFAKGDFNSLTDNSLYGHSLNGYYASGVIEGAYHYGIFNDTD